MRLVDTIDVLDLRYALPYSPTDAFELILWENIGYLIDDERREGLFALFAQTVGLSAAQIECAEDEALLSIARKGGMRPETRVARWREIASIVTGSCEGDLDRTLRSLTVAKARTLLKRFPSIGEPGADKVLLFSGVDVRPSLESNGLRALARLGFIAEQPSYSATYRQAIETLAEEGSLEQD